MKLKPKAADRMGLQKHEFLKLALLRQLLLKRSSMRLKQNSGQGHKDQGLLVGEDPPKVPRRKHKRNTDHAWDRLAVSETNFYLTLHHKKIMSSKVCKYTSFLEESVYYCTFC